MNTPWFEFYKTVTGQYRWRLKAANGEKIASGESYKNKVDMLQTITTINAYCYPIREVKR